MQKVINLKPTHQSWPKIRAGLYASLHLQPFLAINSLITIFSNDGSYPGFTFTFFGLYGLHQLRMTSSRQRMAAGFPTLDVIIWSIFPGVAAVSDYYWFYDTYAYDMGAPVLFPTLFLVAVHFRGPIAIAIKNLRQRFRRSSPAEISLEGDRDSSPGHQQV